MNGEIIRSSAEAGKVSNNKTIEFRLRVVLMILGVCLFLAVKEIYWPVIVSLIITFILTPLRDGIQKGLVRLFRRQVPIDISILLSFVVLIAVIAVMTNSILKPLIGQLNLLANNFSTIVSQTYELVVQLESDHGTGPVVPRGTRPQHLDARAQVVGQQRGTHRMIVAGDRDSRCVWSQSRLGPDQNRRHLEVLPGGRGAILQHQGGFRDTLLQRVVGHRPGLTDGFIRALPTAHHQQGTPSSLDLTPPHPKGPVNTPGQQRGDLPGRNPGTQHHDEVRVDSPDDTLVEPGVPDETEEHQRHPTGGEHDEHRDGKGPSFPDDDDGDADGHCRNESDASEQGQRVGQGETFPAEHDETVEDEESRQADGQQGRHDHQDAQSHQWGREAEDRRHLDAEQ